jgi:hypothetical protein
MHKHIIILSLSLGILLLSGCVQQSKNQAQILPTTGILDVELTEEHSRNLSALQMDITRVQILPASNNSNWITLTTDFTPFVFTFPHDVNTTVTIARATIPIGEYAMVWINLSNPTGTMTGQEFSTDFTMTPGPYLLKTPFQIQSGFNRLLLTFTANATQKNGSSLLDVSLTKALIMHDNQTIILFNQTSRTNEPTDAMPFIDFTVNGEHESVSADLTNRLYFNASACTDPEGKPLSYYWDFGDGENTTDALVMYRYRAPGTYIASLTISDGTNTISKNITITVLDTPGGTGPG